MFTLISHVRMLLSAGQEASLKEEEALGSSVCSMGKRSCSRLLQQITLRQDYVYIGDLGPEVIGLVALMTFPCAGVLTHTAGLEPRNPGPCYVFCLVVLPSSV